jgi:hypothetical protein
MMGLALFLQILNIDTKPSRLRPNTELLATIGLTNILDLIRLDAKAISQRLEQLCMSRRPPGLWPVPRRAWARRSNSIC